MFHSLAKQSRQFHLRDQTFSLEQLKIDFNYRQIENLPYSSATYDLAGLVDQKEKENLLHYPIAL